MKGGKGVLMGEELKREGGRDERQGKQMHIHQQGKGPKLSVLPLLPSFEPLKNTIGWVRVRNLKSPLKTITILTDQQPQTRALPQAQHLLRLLPSCHLYLFLSLSFTFLLFSPIRSTAPQTIPLALLAPKGMPSRALLLWLLLHWQWISAKCQSAESSTEQKAEHERERECPANSQGRSTFLWSLNVSWRTAPAFLFGTIHVPYDRVWRHVSSSAKRAFQRADSVVFELALQKPETVERLIQCKQLPDERGSLRDHLPAQLFGRLAAYMKRLKQKLLHKGFQQGHRSRAQVRRQMSRLFPSNWEQRKPVWLLFLLFQLSDSPSSTEQYAEAPMLDLFMAKLALDQGKALLSLETAAEQCSPLQSVRQEQVLFAINYTLGYLEWAEARAAAGKTEPRLQKAPVDQLISHYSCGTMGTGLEQLVFGAHRFAQTGFSVSPEQYQLARKVDNLLVEDVLLRRNERMARRADLLLHQHPDRTFFFALGAGHFLGQDSLIGQLRRFGYWVTPIDDDQQERASSSSQAMEPLFSQPMPRMGIQLREFAAKSNSPAALVQSTLAFAVAALWPSLAFHWHWLT